MCVMFQLRVAGKYSGSRLETYSVSTVLPSYLTLTNSFALITIFYLISILIIIFNILLYIRTPAIFEISFLKLMYHDLYCTV